MQARVTAMDFDCMIFDLKYKPGEGDPRRIFRTMVELINAVEITGMAFLKGIDPGLSFRIGIQETASGSLVTKAFGMVLGKDGKRLPKDREDMLSQGVAAATKAVLKAQGRVDQKGHVNAKEVVERIAEIQQESAQDYSRLIGDKVPLLINKPVSEKQMRSIMASLATGVFMLEQDDKVAITVDTEAFDLNPDLKPYDTEVVTVEADAAAMAMVEEGFGPKLVRVLTPRYGKTKGWEVIHQDQTYKTEILDKEWFERIHEQYEEVGPKDQLLVEADFEMHQTPSGRHSASCQIHKVVSMKKYNPEGKATLEGMEEPE